MQQNQTGLMGVEIHIFAGLVERIKILVYDFGGVLRHLRVRKGRGPGPTYPKGSEKNRAENRSVSYPAQHRQGAAGNLMPNAQQADQTKKQSLQKRCVWREPGMLININEIAKDQIADKQPAGAEGKHNADGAPVKGAEMVTKCGQGKYSFVSWLVQCLSNVKEAGRMRNVNANQAPAAMGIR